MEYRPYFYATMLFYEPDDIVKNLILIKLAQRAPLVKIVTQKGEIIRILFFSYETNKRFDKGFM